MKKLIFIIPVISIFIAALVLAIVYPSKSETVNIPNKVEIVTAESAWGDIAKQIGGDKVIVRSVISNPNQDPHSYETTTADSRNINETTVVVENGAGYDPFMDQILSSTTSGKQIINISNLAGIQEGDNPHLWYDLNTVKLYAKTLNDKLDNIDSTNSSYYDSNYTTFISSLNDISTICYQINSKYNGTKVIATERVFDYMLSSCGLEIIPNELQKYIEEGNDPSVLSVKIFQKELVTHQAKVLIYNTQTTSSATTALQTLAINSKIPVVGVSETLPFNSTYQHWIKDELTHLLDALSSNG